MDVILNALQLAFRMTSSSLGTSRLTRRSLPCGQPSHAAVEILVRSLTSIIFRPTPAGHGGRDRTDFTLLVGQGADAPHGTPLCIPLYCYRTDVIVGAAFYEREIMEMLGVTFEGHPEPKPLFLPDDWGAAKPLRRPLSPR
jgi:hypothetical protein